MLDMISHMTLPLAVTATDISPGLRGDIWEIVLHSGPVVKTVIILLLFLSVCCWGIMLYKFLMLRTAVKESESFLTVFWESDRLSEIYEQAKKLKQSPLAEIFRSGYMELQKAVSAKKKMEQQAPDRAEGDSNPGPRRVSGLGTVKRALNQATTAEQSRLEKTLGFLATTGSTAPFIGLFGTVWGIMNSFREIGLRGSANLATVAPGISEALIATAFGLVAAIPAVVAYNYFLGKIRMISSEMDNFSSEFLNISERYY